MQAASAVSWFLEQLPGGGQRPLNADEALAVEDALDAAAEWAAGRLPWQEAARQGAMGYRHWQGRMIESTGYGRFVALLVTPHDDPRWQPLARLCDLLSRQQGYVMTTQGTFSREELGEAGAVVR